MKAHLQALVSILFFLLPPSSQADGNYPAPCPPQDGSKPGSRIQRSLSLMATSTPEKRNTVRVLFYGQSITKQGWWKNVAGDLRRRYPHANLIIENRAIGGHSSSRLYKTAEADLYPFYPDLVIFHVYGSHVEYEKIIASIRSRTTADILIQTDHVTKDETLSEETDPAKLTPQNWDAWMNNAFLPQIAEKYGCELANIHRRWKDYLMANKYKAAQLLRDNVHLNAHGEYLMAELVSQYLRYDSESAKAVDSGLVKTLEVGKDIHWQDGKLSVEFDGNRVEALCAEGTSLPSPILIDGMKPSAFPECYVLTKSSGYLGTNWPCLLRVQQGPGITPQAEEWHIAITNPTPDYKSFCFNVTGSKTGADGDGCSNQRFVSKSGRIVIDPTDWNLDYCMQVFKKPLPTDFRITLKIQADCADDFVSTSCPDKSLVSGVLLASGLTNGAHKLEIAGGPQTPIRAIRVYRPPHKP